MNISIVIPVYNSSSIIEILTNDILSETKEIYGVNKIQLILVNDCSTDESWEKISKLSSEYKDIIIGIIVVKMAEVCLITPPIGLNCFVVAGVRKDIPVTDVFKGVTIFFIADILTILVLIMFPAIITWLPDLMM